MKHGAKVEYQKENLSQVNHQLYEWLAIVNDKSSMGSIAYPDDFVNRIFSSFEEVFSTVLQIAVYR